MVRLVLDTGVFFRPAALQRLRDIVVPIVVPATVYMERGRQLNKRGIDNADWDRLLTGHGFIVEPFTPKHAARFAMRVEDDKLWKRIYRDAMIAGHVESDDVLWTTNPEDFLRAGLDADQIVAV